MRDAGQMETSFPQKIRDLMSDGKPAAAFNHLLTRAQDQLFLKEHRSNVLNEELEAACVEVADAIGKAVPLPKASISFARPANIYVVSEIYDTGGHGRILEQMIASRPDEQHIVLFTGLLEGNKDYSIRNISAAGGFPVFAGTQQLTKYDSYVWLRKKLAAYAAQRLVFFHHPQDALAAVAAYEMAPRYGNRLYFYRHTDTTAALGAGLTGATHIVFNTDQQAILKKQTPDVRSLVLPLQYDPKDSAPPTPPKLTAPKPLDSKPLPPTTLAEKLLSPITLAAKRLSPKPQAEAPMVPTRRDFLGADTLITATCGTEPKFTTDGPLAFGRVIAKVLQKTRGVHVHIGPVSGAFYRAAIEALAEHDITADRLIFVGSVRSVAQTLVLNKVDVLLNSFPIAGGLTIIEAAYAGVPVVAYKLEKGSDEEIYMAGTHHVPQGTLLWSTTTDLLPCLQSMASEDALQQAAKNGQDWYNRYFTPQRFRRRLNALYRANELRITQVSLAERDRVLEQLAQPKQDSGGKALEAHSGAALFDPEHYLARNKDVASSGIDPTSHFRDFGDKEHRAAHVLFDAAYYLGNLPAFERALATETPMGHYLARGEAMGYQPHPLFNPEFYKRQIAGKPVQGSLLETYLKTDCDDPTSPHCLFDLPYYMRQLKDPACSQPMLSHFLTVGAKRGLDPHPLIQVQRLGDGDGANNFLAYLSQPAPHLKEPTPYPLFDCAMFSSNHPRFFAPAAPNLLWAYIISGDILGRDPHPLISTEYLLSTGAIDSTSSGVCLKQIAQNQVSWDTHPLIDVAYIQKQAPWLSSTGLDPLTYFLENGVQHNIDPHPYFSLQYYLYNNQDVGQAGVNPLLHYLVKGHLEGRAPHPFFDSAYYANNQIDPATVERQPLMHYVKYGAGRFLATQKDDPVRVEMMRKLSTRLFKLGDFEGAVEMLQDSLYPQTARAHPSLACEIMSFEGGVSDCAQASVSSGFTQISPKEQILLRRPRVLSSKHIAPKIGSYTAPEIVAGFFEYTTVIAGNDGFITENGTWCDDSLVDFDQSHLSLKAAGSVTAINGEKLLMRSHKTSKTIAAAIHACGSYSRNYYHFLIETLPRVILAARQAPLGTLVLTDSEMPKQHLQAIKAALPHSPIRQLTRNSRYAVRKLYTASMGNIIQDSFPKDEVAVDVVRYHPEALRLLHEMGQGIAAESKPRKILLRRNSGARRVINQGEIEAFLVKRGFEVVECERLSFAEQVNLFASAEVIVGQSGAQLANIVFARPGTKVFALYSNVPGSNFYLWSALGQHLGLNVVNVAGSRLVGTTDGAMPAIHEDFTVPVDMLSAFFEEPADDKKLPDTKDDLFSALEALYQANTKADMFTGCWGLLGEDTPDGFERQLEVDRHRAILALNKADDLDSDDLSGALSQPFFTDYGRNIRSGFAALDVTDAKEKTLGSAALKQLVALGKDTLLEDAAVVDLHRALGTAMLTTQAYGAPIARSIEAWPDDLRACYLNWLMSPPFCFRKGEDAAYVKYVHRLLIWLSEKLTADDEPKTQGAIADLATRIDLGTLLMVDQPLLDVSKARNTILEKIAVSKGTPRKTIRSTGRKRIGILCRTFDQGPDSEAVVSFLKTFDQSRYEVFAYSVGFLDRVVKSDPTFDRLFDRTIQHRRLLGTNPKDIRAKIIEDDLDVFLFANATTYGLQPLDLAIYHRVAPIQMILNCHLPMTLGYPSFDYLITGKSDEPSTEPAQADYAETLLRLPGPVINYQNSLLKDAAPLFDRSALGLKDSDVMLLNAGSLSKLRHECLHTMLRAVKDIPNGVLVLAPYNPGWVARSQAFAFNRQLLDTAAEVGVAPDKIRVMGELSVAEAESLLQLCDIYLNPFPHGGATMTHLALIYGALPVTMRRRTIRSIDQFLINSVGGSSLLVSSTDAYVARVAALARDTKERAELSVRLKTCSAKPIFVDNPAYSNKMLAIVDEVVKKQMS